MKLLRLLLATVFLACCSFGANAVKIYTDHAGEPRIFSSFPIKWGFSCSFPEAMKPQVRRAFQYWDDMTPAQLFSEASSCGIVDYNNGIYVISSDSEYEKGDEQVWGTAHAAIRNDELKGAVITVWKPWLLSKEVKLQESVIRHEIGHALGYDHGGDARCLMYPYITENHGLLGLCGPEREQFRRLYGRVRLDR